MRVLCTNRGHGDQRLNPLVIGNTYNTTSEGVWPGGIKYYTLAEFSVFGIDLEFDTNFFSPLPDVDETELVERLEKEAV